MRALTRSLTRHLESEETVQNLWCLAYSAAIVAAWVVALDHIL